MHERDTGAERTNYNQDRERREGRLGKWIADTFPNYGGILVNRDLAWWLEHKPESMVMFESHEITMDLPTPTGDDDWKKFAEMAKECRDPYRS